MTNEAARWLRIGRYTDDAQGQAQYEADIVAALAAERRATVERIRKRVDALEVAEAHFGSIVGTFENVRHILKDEGDR